MSLKRSSSLAVSLSTLRFMIALVAVAALLLWGSMEVVRLLKLSKRYQQMAAYCGKVEATYVGYHDKYVKELEDFEKKSIPKSSLSFISLSPPGRERVFAEEGAARNRELAARYGKLKTLYQNAANQPWVVVSEELQHPPWEEVLNQRGRGDGEY